MTWEPETSADLEEKLAVVGPPISTTLAPLHRPRSGNTQYATKSYEIFKKRSKEDGFQGIISRLGLAPGIRDFFQFKDGLSTVDGVILYNNMVPSPLRALILDTPHSAHQGVSCIITIHIPVRTSRILLVRFLSNQSANIFFEVLHLSHITRIDRTLR